MSITQLRSISEHLGFFLMSSRRNLRDASPNIEIAGRAENPAWVKRRAALLNCLELKCAKRHRLPKDRAIWRGKCSRLLPSKPHDSGDYFNDEEE